MPIPDAIAKLIGQTSAGDTSANEIQIESASLVIRRSVGLVADTFQCLVDRDSLWPVDWDLNRPIAVQIGDDDQFVTPGGYYLGRVENVTPGQDLAGGPGSMRQSLLTFQTVVGRMWDGRGGLLTAGTLNRLGDDGQPDTGDADYQSTSDLVSIAGSVIAGTSTDWDLSFSIDGLLVLDTIDPGGPFDWSNVRALPELADLLASIGWAATLNHAGDTITVHRLPRAGEPLTLPTSITDVAEPYALASTPASRSKYVVVTSGRTRTTVLTRRSLNDLEWVYYDERTNAWLNQTEHDLLYPSEVGPADVSELQAGPSNDQKRNAQLSRVFTALRLVNDPAPGGLQDRRNASRFVALPGQFAIDGKTLSGTPAFIECLHCVELEDGKFINEPELDVDPPLRVEVSVVPGEGVIKMPVGKGDPVMARVVGSGTGIFFSLRALSGSELDLYFAHEADTGDQDTDYFREVYRSDLVGSTMTAVRVTDPAERQAALDDPASVVIEQPSLRRVVEWDPDDPDFTPLNDTELQAIAQRYAEIRAGADLTESGLIELDGLYEIEPGSVNGAVSAVIHSLATRKTTLVINQHDVPRSVYSELERLSNRSIATGLSRFRLPGSSASVHDVRDGSTPGETAGAPPHGGIGPAELDPAQGPATRGADRAAGTKRSVAGPRLPRAERFGRHAIDAVFTSATLISGAANRWEYEWSEVEFTGPGTYTKKGRTSATLGKAYNRAEMGNSASGVQPDGVNASKLLGTFEKKPIGEGMPVRLIGPYRDPGGGDDYWLADPLVNQYDGECPA